MEASDVETGTATEQVLSVLFEGVLDTSPEIVKALNMPKSQVSSVLSRMFKKIPELLARNTEAKPYRWRLSREVTPVEAYLRFIAPQKELLKPAYASTEERIGGGVVELVGTPTEVVVKVTGRIEIVVGWAEKL